MECAHFVRAIFDSPAAEAGRYGDLAGIVSLHATAPGTSRPRRSLSHMKASASESPRHFAIKQGILDACARAAVDAKAEARGKGWRADVLARTPSMPVAFEVQTSPQSLAKTIERQERFWQSGVAGCWLFLEGKKLRHLNEERPDLPLFFVGEGSSGEFTVSLGDRRVLSLERFASEYVQGRIRFCSDAVSKPTQELRLLFYEMPCWKCGQMNHPYMLEEPFKASCNAVAHPNETLWGSSKSEYRPDIVFAAERFAAQHTGVSLVLPSVGVRHSNTVGHEYLSFGCRFCDSIFGDWYIMEAEMEIAYGGAVAEGNVAVAMTDIFNKPIPHWCYPEEGSYCLSSAVPPFEKSGA